MGWHEHTAHSTRFLLLDRIFYATAHVFYCLIASSMLCMHVESLRALTAVLGSDGGNNRDNEYLPQATIPSPPSSPSPSLLPKLRLARGRNGASSPPAPAAAPLELLLFLEFVTRKRGQTAVQCTSIQQESKQAKVACLLSLVAFRVEKNGKP